MSPRTMARATIKTYLLILVLISFVSINKAVAMEKYVDPLQLHIEEYCRKDCVDNDLLRIAVQSAYLEKKVDPLLMTAIIHVESRFRVRAENKTNGRSIGLSQIQIRWHKARFSGKNYFDVIENIVVGAEIYKECEKRNKGVVKKALWCYNGHQKKGMRDYVPKVLKVYNELKRKNIII